MKSKRFGLAASLLILVNLFIFASCNTKSPVSVNQVKNDIVGVWISGAIDAEYVKIEFDKNGTYQLWTTTGFVKNWGEPLLSGTYTVAMDKDAGAVAFPVVTLEGSAPYSYKISFRDTQPMLVNANIVEIPINKTSTNPW